MPTSLPLGFETRRNRMTQAELTHMDSFPAEKPDDGPKLSTAENMTHNFDPPPARPPSEVVQVNKPDSGNSPFSNEARHYDATLITPQLPQRLTKEQHAQQLAASRVKVVNKAPPANPFANSSRHSAPAPYAPPAKALSPVSSSLLSSHNHSHGHNHQAQKTRTPAPLPDYINNMSSSARVDMVTIASHSSLKL